MKQRPLHAEAVIDVDQWHAGEPGWNSQNSVLKRLAEITDALVVK